MTEQTTQKTPGLVAQLQAIAPSMATQLTMERLSFMKTIATLTRQRDELLTAADYVVNNATAGEDATLNVKGYNLLCAAITNAAAREGQPQAPGT